MDEELTTMQKLSNMSFVIVSFALSIIFLLTTVSVVKGQSKYKKFSDNNLVLEDPQISELKVQDARLEGRIEKLTSVVEGLARQEEINTQKIYDLNSRLVWVYGTGGGAFGLMGFLQFINAKKRK